MLILIDFESFINFGASSTLRICGYAHKNHVCMHICMYENHCNGFA